MQRIRAVPDVCDIEVVAAPGTDPDAPPDLVFEVPHGATRRSHFEAIRRMLSGELPADLEAFFFVNTDVGAFECARYTARLLAGPHAAGARHRAPRSRHSRSPDAPAVVEPRRTRRHPAGYKVLIVRCLLPRTLVDCNRTIEAGPGAPRNREYTLAIPRYVKAADDVETLRRLHGLYQRVAEYAFESVCGRGGNAVIFHTYAPRTVRIDDVGEDIVERLRRAYAPEVYDTWEKRPEVDIISEATDGTPLASATLVEAVTRHYAAIGVKAAENASYRLDPATTAYHHAARYPGQTLCIEINRALLAEPFSPFEEMRVGERNVARMSAPIAAGLLEAHRGSSTA